MKRLGKPEEIGWPLAFLCSHAVGFMTGAVIDVNGGMAFSWQKIRLGLIG